MNKFGVLKTKILKKLTESYSNKNKEEVKDILNTIKENKDFKEMYLFYEEIENKYFDDKEIAKLYVEEIKSVLKDKSDKIASFSKNLNTKLKDVEINENELYSYLDLLVQEENLSNVDKKIIAKKKLVEHLTTKKQQEVKKEDTQLVENENLLYAVLANNFNVLYNNSLNESQKKELQGILSLTDEDLEIKVGDLKESILGQVGTILSESKDVDLSNKLTKVKDEVNEMKPSKFNYYRLVQLKNGLV
jgi:hypothetical protein